MTSGSHPLGSQTQKKGCGHINSLILNNHDTVSIIGGGPAGTFLAAQLLNRARNVGRHLDISIIENRISKGCNSCAGVISPGLYQDLKTCGLEPPPEAICENYSHVWIQGSWKNFPLKVPPGQKLCSVFRGGLPSDRDSKILGFDGFLIKRLMQKGVKIIQGEAADLRISDGRQPVIRVLTKNGPDMDVESDLVCICCGVNLSQTPGLESSTLLDAVKRIDPDFKPPKTRQTFIFEIKTGRDFISKYLEKELYLIVTGSKTLQLEHIALVPKQEHISAALVGESVDSASFPRDTRGVIDAFLSLPQVQSILPGITPENISVSCSCSPRMVTGVSRPIHADRICMSGDILGARLYRDGLYSAFKSAQAMADTVIYRGIDKQNLVNEALKITRSLEKDNQYCKKIFTSMQAALKSGLSSRILYQSFATEMKFRPTGRWPLGDLLWKVASGGAEYKNVTRALLKPAILISLAVGTLKTFRNVITEYFFGLNWGAFGRYPAVIIKDQREKIKQSIQKPLKITLDRSPEMERMYAVKIRASSKTIFAELAKFGEIDSDFLKLRFVDVKRTSGTANQTGSVVTYHLKHTPVAMDIRLSKVVPGKTLLYEPEELFTDRGKLIFDITPTKDGNNRLVIYTAFDYRRGQRIPGKLFFSLFRYLFPDFAHDVVWNHAICTIKAEAEKSDLNSRHI